MRSASRIFVLRSSTSGGNAFAVSSFSVSCAWYALIPQKLGLEMRVAREGGETEEEGSGARGRKLEATEMEDRRNGGGQRSAHLDQKS